MFDTKADLVTGWNRRAAEFPPAWNGEIECAMCGDTFTEADLEEFHEIGEEYHREKGCFLCPDCWFSFQMMPLEQQASLAINKRLNKRLMDTRHEEKGNAV